MTDALAPTAGHFPTSGDRPTASAQGFWLASWFAALSQSDPASLRYLLLLRFALLNLVGVALVAAVWAHGWLDGMIATDIYHLVKLNVGDADLDQVIDLLPSMKAPTVSKLHGDGGYAVETVVERRGVNVLIPALKDAGASDIIELPLAKIVH